MIITKKIKINVAIEDHNMHLCNTGTTPCIWLRTDMMGNICSLTEKRLNDSLVNGKRLVYRCEYCQKTFK